jgi:hypothetical protein
MAEALRQAQRLDPRELRHRREHGHEPEILGDVAKRLVADGE